MMRCKLRELRVFLCESLEPTGDSYVDSHNEQITSGGYFYRSGSGTTYVVAPADTIEILLKTEPENFERDLFCKLGGTGFEGNGSIMAIKRGREGYVQDTLREFGIEHSHKSALSPHLHMVSQGGPYRSR